MFNLRERKHTVKTGTLPCQSHVRVFFVMGFRILNLLLVGVHRAIFDAKDISSHLTMMNERVIVDWQK